MRPALQWPSGRAVSAARGVAAAPAPTRAASGGVWRRRGAWAAAPGSQGRGIGTARSAAPGDKDAATRTPTGDKGAAQRGLAALAPGTPLYGVVELVELLLILMLVDAGFSGDWSRIGVVTTDTELVLQKLSAVVLVGHLITAAAAGSLASRKGKSPWVPALRGLLFGALGLYEEQNAP